MFQVHLALSLHQCYNQQFLQRNFLFWRMDFRNKNKGIYVCVYAQTCLYSYLFLYLFILKTIYVSLVISSSNHTRQGCSNSLPFHINKWLLFNFNMFTYLISLPLCNQHPSLLPTAPTQAQAPHSSVFFFLLGLSLPLVGI